MSALKPDAYVDQQLMHKLDSTDPDKHDFEFFVSPYYVVTWSQHAANSQLRSNGKDRPTTILRGSLGLALPHIAASVDSKTIIARS